MTFVPLTLAESDAKSPLDDTLLEKIKNNFDDLDSRVTAAGVSPHSWEVIGRLSFLNTYPQKRALGAAYTTKEFTPTICRYTLKKSGLSGSLTFDIRKAQSPNTPITAIEPMFSGATTSIGRAGSSLNTQSIARATTQISTQSITHAKSALNIQSIVALGAITGLCSNGFLYNLASPLDSDSVVGDAVTVASATSGGNNGTFTMIAVGYGGGNNFLVDNASGAAQTSPAGTAQVKIMSYNFTNPVDSLFTAGFAHKFTSHTNAANDGTFTVFKINQGGNNILVKNSAGVTQGSPAGTADCNFWKFNLSVAASATDYVVGENALTAGHSSGANNSSGGLLVIAVNLSGNNLVLYNVAGVAQAGVAGTVDTMRWVYAMPTDPSTQIIAGESIYATSHSSGGNNGQFTVKQVNRASANNIVVYNPSGVAQVGAAGLVVTTKKLVKMASDQSAIYTTKSIIEIKGAVSSAYNLSDSVPPVPVTQVNRGGGANFNLVIDVGGDIPTQPNPAGFIQTEMKSVFNTAPSLAASVTSVDPNLNLKASSTDLLTDVIPADTPLLLFITGQMTGDPQDFNVSLL